MLRSRSDSGQGARGPVVEDPIPDYVHECSNRRTNRQPNEGANDAARYAGERPGNQGPYRCVTRSARFSIGASFRNAVEPRLLDMRD